MLSWSKTDQEDPEEGVVAETTSRTRAQAAEEAPVAAPKFHVVESKEPTFSVSPRNPAGDIMTIRAPLVVSVTSDGQLDLAQTVKDTWDLFQALLERAVGFNKDTAELYAASFDPSVAQMIREGKSAAAILGIDEDKMTMEQQAAIEGLRARGASGASGGRQGGGGGSANNLIDLDKMPDAEYGQLPKAFLDELKGKVYCPECGESKFWDNRVDPGKGPLIRCANKDGCKSVKSQKGTWYPWSWWGEDSKSNDGNATGGRGGSSGRGGRGGRGD